MLIDYYKITQLSRFAENLNLTSFRENEGSLTFWKVPLPLREYINFQTDLITNLNRAIAPVKEKYLAKVNYAIGLETEDLNAGTSLEPILIQPGDARKTAHLELNRSQLKALLNITIQRIAEDRENKNEICTKYVELQKILRSTLEAAGEATI